ncbi:MAG: protease complex subunit PrcB family protein [Balneolaceae bacterium]
MTQLIQFSTYLLNLIFMLSACSAISDDTVTVNDVVEIESGHYAAYPDSGVVQKLITSPTEFKSEWEKIFESRQPTPELPNVDFENRRVVLLLMEGKPNGGYSIDDVQLKENADLRTISYTEFGPGNNCFTTQALTRPFYFASIPKSDKEIEFKKQVDVVDCNE